MEEDNELAGRDYFRGLYHFATAKGGPLEQLMVNKMVARGTPENEAREAARRCSNQMWKDGISYGLATAVMMSIAAPAVPIAAGVAGLSMAVAAGYHALITNEACSGVVDENLYSTVKQINTDE